MPLAERLLQPGVGMVYLRREQRARRMTGGKWDRMDIFVLKALTDELRQCLRGAVVSKVFQMSPEDILLRLWRQQDHRLLLSVAPAWPRLHLTTARFRNPQQPPRFAALLRAHLDQVRLSDIVVRPYDRVVIMSWVLPGTATPMYQLIHELQGTQANLLLVDANGLILDACKQVAPGTSAQRALLPGQPYTPRPRPPQRCLLSEVTLEHLQALQSAGALAAQGLQRLVVGLSPLLAAEIGHRSAGSPQRCWDILQALRQQYDQGTLRLWHTTSADGTQHLSALPLTHLAAHSTAVACVSDAVTAWCEPHLETTALSQRRQTLQKTVHQRLQKLRQKMGHLQQEAQTLTSYEPYQRYGTLLVTQRVPRGATSVTVVDYYSPDQTALTIALDPRLSLRDNAQVYFKKYRKAQYGAVKVQSLLTACAAEVQYLDGLEAQVFQAEDIATLEAIADELGTPAVPAGLPRHPVLPTPAALPYRTFVLEEGVTVYCGKHNQGNDALLRHIAAPEDLWLHAHHHAGAHVLLKVTHGREVAAALLQRVAALAAFYSKGKEAPVVEVLYTQAKHVRKFRGARPGQVRVLEYQTVSVPPQPLTL